jgi:hypothetical protein
MLGCCWGAVAGGRGKRICMVCCFSHARGAWWSWLLGLPDPWSGRHPVGVRASSENFASTSVAAGSGNSCGGCYTLLKVLLWSFRAILSWGVGAPGENPSSGSIRADNDDVSSPLPPWRRCLGCPTSCRSWGSCAFVVSLALGSVAAGAAAPDGGCASRWRPRDPLRARANLGYVSSGHRTPGQACIPW